MSYARGHVKRTPKVTRTAQAWYDEIQAALLARIEAAIAAQQARAAETAATAQPKAA